MENAGRQRCIGLALSQDIGDVRHAARPAGGDDGDAQAVRELRIDFARIACTSAVVVHRGEQDLASAALLGFPGPGKEFFVGGPAATVRRGVPASLAVGFRVDGDDNELPSVFPCNPADQVRIGNRSTVEGNLVGTGIQQSVGVVQTPDASANGERNVDGPCDPCDQFYKGAACFPGGTDVSIDPFIGPTPRLAPA